MTDTIYLTGFMGAGKTTVARRLARTLGLPLEDLDRRIEEAEGREPARIFREDGEAAFRGLEAIHVREIVSPAVVALGGGAFIDPLEFAYLRDTGISVFLDWPFDVLQRRIHGDLKRPLVRDIASLHQTYLVRLPAYRRADIIWSSRPPHRETVARVVRDIVPMIRLRQSERSGPSSPVGKSPRNEK